MVKNFQKILKILFFIGLEVIFEHLLFLASSIMIGVLYFLSESVVRPGSNPYNPIHHVIGFMCVSMVITYIIRLPWQIVLSYIFRFWLFGRNFNFYHGTFKPIIYTYIPCCAIFFWFFSDWYNYNISSMPLLLTLNFFSLAYALLAPYLLYRMVGKTMEDYVKSNVNLFEKLSR